jgi:acyl-CoA synthetase (NDP forming)
MLNILQRAAAEGRSTLLEYEVYDFLRKTGFNTPRFHLHAQGDTIADDLLDRFPGDRIVLKIMAPNILHKSDVGGVRFVDNDIYTVNSAISNMLEEAPANVLADCRANPDHYPEEWQNNSEEELLTAVAKDIKGVLLVEYIESDPGFGNELLLGLKHNREFGPVLTYGAGGIDTEFFRQHFRRYRSHAIRAARLLDSHEALVDMIRQPVVYKKLAGQTRDKKVRLDEEQLLQALEQFRDLALEFTDGTGSEWTIEELEINPLLVRDGRLLPLDGLLRFRPSRPVAVARPQEDIERLLNARSVGLIGVSEKMNIGHIILRNLINYDFPLQRLHIVKPNCDTIDGVKCVDTVAELPEKVDMFVVSVAAAQVPEVMEELIQHDRAHGVLLIPGGMGEKEGTGNIQTSIQEMIARARAAGKGPVVNGGNCLGLYSQPGNFNTLFIPEYKLPRPAGKNEPKIAFISQSGAFMIARMSKLPFLNPVWAVSTGNQIDLTMADYLEFMSGQDVDVVAAYVEGFQDLDGDRFARITREMTAAGKRVILYKSGRTQTGKSAASGHTASIAGDYDVCEEVMKNAGAEVADTFLDFENYLVLHTFLDKRPIRGTRTAIISNAGFETVGIADNLEGTHFTHEYGLTAPPFSPETTAQIQEVFKQARLDGLVDVHNPLDMTPMASDAAWEGCVRTLLSDSATDLAIISIVPLTVAMQTLLPGEAHREDLNSAASFASIAARLAEEYDKPFVIAVDSGKLYDAYADAFFAAGIPVFRTADQAARFLGKFVSLQLG